jgi:hypothetical protein
VASARHLVSTALSLRLSGAGQLRPSGGASKKAARAPLELAAPRHDARPRPWHLGPDGGEWRRRPPGLVGRLHIVHPVAQESGAVALDTAEYRGVSGGGQDFGATTGALDEAGHILGTGEHIVVGGGDSGTPQEAPDLTQVRFEVRIDLLPRPGPRGRIKLPAGLHVANL